MKKQGIDPEVIRGVNCQDIRELMYIMDFWTIVFSEQIPLEQMLMPRDVGFKRIRIESTHDDVWGAVRRYLEGKKDGESNV